MSDTEELVFAPATPGNEAWLIALVGPSGAGKTNSALRLARGIAGPNGRIGVADTENNRAKFFARDFQFDHASIREPYRPEKYTTAVERSKAQGHSVLIIDSMSHEWAGLGGLLDWHEQELSRMAGNDYGKREKMTYAAWIAPKAAHKAMMNRLLALNTHVIFCLRAEPKIKLVKNDKGKIVPVDQGFQPICEKLFMFDMTVAFMLTPDRPGVGVPIKPLLHRHAALFDLTRPFDEETGQRIASYARGEEVKQEPRGDAKNQAVADGLIARFNATTTREEHMEIVEGEKARLDWFRERRPALYEQISAALSVSFARFKAAEEPSPEDDAGADETRSEEAAEMT